MSDKAANNDQDLWQGRGRLEGFTDVGQIVGNPPAMGLSTPKPCYRCQHVQAGYLTAARLVTDKAVIGVCHLCYRDGYHSLKLTDEGGVIKC